ncbi:DUF3987 domain-containing protein [Micromonospora sp. NBRC 101691]|uniref:DUF3987 domain-containing protein n=1 Tax=Micromonospora sp. NBRC 101691 TaxID=3032198 RepID=UPI0024A3779F|nr:DUF3987 domain-containing protein [Micromonospora sp. NBRC 101691]GLY24840.1 hypothetical protein Misp04_45720 [Micromonospora sp. NBRC 101691]
MGCGAHTGRPLACRRLPAPHTPRRIPTTAGGDSPYGGALVRIAGLIHLAEHLRDGWDRPVTAGTIDKAALLGDYYAAWPRATTWAPKTAPARATRTRCERQANLTARRGRSGAQVVAHAACQGRV